MSALALSSYLSFGYLAPLVVDVLLLMTLALSLNLINGCAGMFSLGHQGFYGVGAYAAGAFLVYLGPSLGPVALPLSILSGGLAAAAFGLLVGIPCLRLKGDYLAIATLGFAEIFRVAVSQLGFLGESRGLTVVEPPLFSRSRDERVRFYVLMIAIAAALVVLTLVVIRNLMRSSHGRAIYAIREDEIAAEILGVDLTRYKVAVFAIGALFAGLAGGVLVNAKLYITPIDFGLMFGVVLLLFVVLGGQGSSIGSMIAVLVIFGLERVLATQVFGTLPAAAEEFVRGWWQVIYALLLVVIVIARPQGILGKKSA